MPPLSSKAILRYSIDPHKNFLGYKRLRYHYHNFFFFSVFRIRLIEKPNNNHIRLEDWPQFENAKFSLF